MKNFLTPLLLLVVGFANAQLLSWTPSFIQETSALPITITANAAYGNKALYNYNAFGVYVHMGVITTSSTTPGDWRYVKTQWGTSGKAYSWEQAFPASGKSRWTYTIKDSIGVTDLRTYFGITDPNEHILKIAILFRNETGSKQLDNSDGSDMFISVYGSGENVRIDVPITQPTFDPELVPITASVGTNVPITANASLAGSAMNVYFNGNLLSSTTGTTDTTTATVTATGTQTIVATATSGGVTSSDTVVFYVKPSNTVAAVPVGNSDGINYEPGDTSATLVLYAPNKGTILVVGDFNNWTPEPNYQMNVTPDGNRFWLRLTGLTPGTEYAYQYLIDDTLQVADYNSDKILDKSVDPQIPATTYPNLKAFPVKAAGQQVSVLQTAQTPYVWKVPNFNRPDKRNLLIYELWVEDFVYSQNWQALTDTLFYLKKLGVNAIEVMPFNNFEGYTSWGYNSNYFFAPDKVYGTRDALRKFVDACHSQGIAVIMDLAMAEVSGSSPLASMYWNKAANTPATNNPWLNITPTNKNVVSIQFNHSAQATIDLRNRVYKHWLKDYNLDGFRFDLFGGYTQNFSDGSYDQTRVDNASNINASMQSISPGSYCILESFEPENATQVNNGLLVWGAGKLTSQVSQADESNLTSSDFVSAGLYTNNGCNQAGIVDYQESHDEARVMYNVEQYGKTYGTYNTKTVTTALQRAAMGTAFWALMPGPKMMFMFGELGYDYGANECVNGATTCGKLDPKPMPWSNYYVDPNRQALFSVYSKLLNLRQAYPSTFYDANSMNYNTSGLVRWMNLYSSSLQVTVFGNFDVAQQTGTVSFPSNGTWYNLFTGATFNVSNYSASVTLNPGEYYVYVNTQAALTVPVRWLDFTAQAENGGAVLLNFTTTNEMTNDHYDIERSTDGINFTHIGSVNAIRGAANSTAYNYSDITAPTGKVYYRIKQVDVNGQYTFSKVVALTINNGSGLWHTYFTGNSVKVVIQADMNKVNIVLRDALGRVLTQQTTTKVTNGQVIEIPTNSYSKGLYLISVTSEIGSRTDKVIVK